MQRLVRSHATHALRASMRATALLFALSVATFALPASSQTSARPSDAMRLPAGMTRVTSVEGITEYALPNGLHVLTLPDASKPTTTVNLTIRVGSRMENYGETGMAHLLEHLMFKGTPHFPDPKKTMSDRGLSWNGVDVGRPHELLREHGREPGQPRRLPARGCPRR